MNKASEKATTRSLKVMNGKASFSPKLSPPTKDSKSRKNGDGTNRTSLQGRKEVEEGPLGRMLLLL